jgi:hypothetical protein
VIKLPLTLILLYAASASYAEGYDRKDFSYQSYKPDTSIGFYTGQPCALINIDHIVSLKDAYDSGAASWGASKKESFADDRSNHVPSCGPVNSHKARLLRTKLKLWLLLSLYFSLH